MRLLPVLLTAAVLFAIPGTVAARPFETGMYVSIYGTDNSTWGMTPANPQYQAYKTSDFDAILSRIKADGFDIVYLLPGDWLGPRVFWKTDLPLLKTKEEWTNAGRDMMEELLSAADKHHLKVYLCLLGVERNQYDWWQKTFPGEAWTSPDRNMNDFLTIARKVSIPAMQEIVRRYGKHRSLVGFGTDEVHFSGDYFKPGLSTGTTGVEAIDLYCEQSGEAPPSLDPFPAQLDEKADRLLTLREGVLSAYHRMIADACRAQGMEYTTTLNSSMLGKLRWEGLGGERAAFGSDVWHIANLRNNSEVATDFYTTRLSSHIQADLTKFFASPLYGKPVNMVLGTQFGADILAKHLMDSLAEGIDRITYWTNVYYYGEGNSTKNMWAPSDPDRISYLVKAAKEFRKVVPIKPRYDVAVLVNRAWQRDHYRADDPRQSEIAQMSHAVDALNMAGYRYDIVSDDEASAGGLKGIPAVIMPLGIGLTETAIAALEDYVKRGGFVIVYAGLGVYAPWGDQIDPKLRERADSLLKSPRVIYFDKLIGQHGTSDLAAILKLAPVAPSSPLLADTEHLEMAADDYDTYWGPKPAFPVNGKIYDLYWWGDRYQAFSIGHRSNADGKLYTIGRCTTRLKAYQTMIAGISKTGGEYDVFFVNSDREITVEAAKVKVFGRDDKWSERRAKPGETSITLAGPALVRIL